ncbi:MAG: MgtE integral membrane protein [Halanaerobium sp.]|nr:MAG: MgtE integral membrane protein [Halanaerobium sp. T82-1]PUU89065.1 MAG: MgtE integral membrane protein [Halanaerobium sp.]PUU92844.1 MAG: MgtE integral membrane protein [Halanaerobium sp.]
MLSWSLNALGVIDVKTAAYNIASKIPFINNYLVSRAEMTQLENENQKLQQTIKAKETKITELEARVQNLEAELDERDQRIAGIQNDYNELLTDRENTEAKYEKVTKIYRRMEPEAAAAVIMQMEQELAVEILSRLKEEQAAAVIESLSQDKAAEIMSLLSQ